MRPVGSEYMEQYNALLRYVFQVTDQELNSIGWQEKEIIRAKFPTMEKADVIGWFDNDNLISQVAVYPMQVQIFGKTFYGTADRSRNLPGILQYGTDAQAFGAGTQKYAEKKAVYLLSVSVLDSLLPQKRLGAYLR